MEDTWNKSNQSSLQTWRRQKQPKGQLWHADNMLGECACPLGSCSCREQKVKLEFAARLGLVLFIYPSQLETKLNITKSYIIFHIFHRKLWKVIQLNIFILFEKYKNSNDIVVGPITMLTLVRLHVCVSVIDCHTKLSPCVCSYAKQRYVAVCFQVREQWSGVVVVVGIDVVSNPSRSVVC